MHSVHLTSHSLTKDSFLLDFIFLLIVTITNRAETDPIPDTMKTVGKKHTILKRVLHLQIPLACIWQSNCLN